MTVVIGFNVLWIRIRGKVKADIMVGVCYRPPNQDEEADEIFYKHLREVLESLALVLMVDFNLPDVCWKYNTAERKQSKRFLECVEDNFLTQLVSEPTREQASLNLLFANREGLVGDVMVASCLGHNDHKIIEFLILGELHSNSDKGDGSVKYILTGEGAGTIFIIDDTTGDIHSTKSLDREQKTHYVLHAQAIDRRTNKPLEPESEFIIKVQDINDNAPKFTDGPYIVTVPEMSEMGTSVLQVTATDADDPTYGNSARVVYSILQGQPYFSVDPKT
ncbi:PREDICTED: cadherin-18-like, partial [Tauraco erythrolophus]|uniref:cadherin-18-like n=1 Tax=Tauraco erythrolophus TaxID=121530 RepID=UPI00052382A0